MTEEKKIKFGWGTCEEHCEADTYDTVNELLEAAQESWDNMDGNPDSDCEYSGCIYVGIAESFEPADFAPSLDDIADQMTDRFYSDHNIDDDADVKVYHNRSQAEQEWKAFINKYFDIPCTIVTSWSVGLYDLKEHKWIEKYAAFNKYVKEDSEQ